MGGSAGHHLEPHALDVAGRPAMYSVGGDGFPVLFLHGWGLADHSYRRALKRLVAQGCRVYAPSLPGFGGTADLPRDERTVEGFAIWVREFIETVAIDESALVVGHSFGGGVAIRLAHDFPALVRYLVLLNSVGAPQQGRGLSALNRSGWLWGLRALRDPIPISEGVQVLRAAAEDLIPNLVRHPRTMVEVGTLARQVDLSAELEELANRDLPVLVLWGDHDRVLPTGSFEALCRAIGTEGKTVHGNHSWVLADPDAFGEVMSNVVHISARGDTSELLQLLEGTSVPADVVTALLERAAPLWLMSEPPATLAGDLALCHPSLSTGEVRAAAMSSEDAGSFRLTVVAQDRPGLLADTTALLAAEGLSVERGSATTWEEGIALHSLTVSSPQDFLTDSWDLLAKRLRAVADGEAAEFLFEPGGRAVVHSTQQGTGRALVSVLAPDQLGLLWAVCAWFAEHEVSIEAMRVSSEEGVARDEFVVKGSFDPDALAGHLSARDEPIWDRLGFGLVRSAVGAVRNLTPFRG